MGGTNVYETVKCIMSRKYQDTHKKCNVSNVTAITEKSIFTLRVPDVS